MVSNKLNCMKTKYSFCLHPHEYQIMDLCSTSLLHCVIYNPVLWFLTFQKEITLDWISICYCNHLNRGYTIQIDRYCVDLCLISVKRFLMAREGFRGKYDLHSQGKTIVKFPWLFHSPQHSGQCPMVLDPAYSLNTKPHQLHHEFYRGSTCSPICNGVWRPLLKCYDGRVSCP